MNEDRSRRRLEVEAFYLVEFRLSAGENGLTWYTLYVNCDQPISQDGRPIIFADPSSAEFALTSSDFAGDSELHIPTEVDCSLDFAEALRTIDDYEVDTLPDANLLNCLNSLLDFVKLLNVPPPEDYIRSLGKLADFLTFSMEIGRYFTESTDRRGEIAVVFRTCLGAVASEVIQL